MDDIELMLLFSTLALAMGFGTCWLWQWSRSQTYKQLAKDIIQRAERDAEALRQRADLAARQEQLDRQRENEAVWQQEKRKLQKEEERLEEREDKLEKRFATLEKKCTETEKRDATFTQRSRQLDEEAKLLDQRAADLARQLEQLAGLSKDQARDMVLTRVTHEIQAETSRLMHLKQREAEMEAERFAKSAIATAINRLAVPCVSEGTVTTVAIPNDEIKRRVIGREGRNIRTLERLTGVNLLIDDTPGAVVLSSFDPVRKQIAKLALTELVRDGRIHPTRIEEAVEQAKQQVEHLIKQYGEDAALRAGVLGLHPDIITQLGKLKFRYSYGQNILEHSLEVAHLLGLMAAELGLDIRLAKRIGLLHDMGKALSHEVEGSHAMVGHDLALKCGESRDVANGIGCHHGEMPAATIEGSLCAAADALSASRPGARIEAVEAYVKRLQNLEEIATSFPGVERAYALQAGREIQISVLPELVDDTSLSQLARDVTKRIEAELSYPGKIKVTLIREKRAVHYAL